MLKVGITGGIGSGKSTICKIFEILGVPVYYADIRAKELMNTDIELKEALTNHFGKSIYTNNTLNRSKLAEIIFINKTALNLVNSLVHPVVGRDFTQWAEQQSSPYVLEESAILYENNMTKHFWKIILVTAPESLKIKRVCERDNVKISEVLQRMENQLPDEQKIIQADYVINNDGLHMMIPQVIDIHNNLLSTARG